MVTNGKLLYERAEELVDVDYLSVSVDGVDSYKEIRRMDFETLLKGLKKAIRVRKLQKKNNPILMNCVLTGKNLDDIETLILLAKKLGVKVSFEPVHEFPGISEEIWKDIGIRDKEKFHCTVDHIIELKKQGYPIINSKTYLKMVRDGKMDYKCRASGVIINVTHARNTGFLSTASRLISGSAAFSVPIRPRFLAAVILTLEFLSSRSPRSAFSTSGPLA